MWKKQETVLYANNGLCLIEDVRQESFSGESRTYYVLAPLNDSKSRVYVPTDNEIVLKKMHKLLSEEQAVELIKALPSLETEWISHDKMRQDFFKKALESGDRRAIGAAYRTLTLKKKELEGRGKKLRAADEAILSNAQKMLLEEFSFVLGEDPEKLILLFKESEQNC